jgi:hypothetical protein
MCSAPALAGGGRLLGCPCGRVLVVVRQLTVGVCVPDWRRGSELAPDGQSIPAGHVPLSAVVGCAATLHERKGWSEDLARERAAIRTMRATADLAGFLPARLVMAV